jgi:hypothetical protein
MLAAGLPVVSTMMRPLVGISNELHVAKNGNEFVSVFSRIDRRKLSPSQKSVMRDDSLRYDYESRFPLLLSAIGDAVEKESPLRVRLDEFAKALSTAEFGAARELKMASADFAGDTSSYMHELTRALRACVSIKELLKWKIGSSAVVLEVHRLLRSTRLIGSIARFVRGWLQSSNSTTA